MAGSVPPTIVVTFVVLLLVTMVIVTSFSWSMPRRRNIHIMERDDPVDTFEGVGLTTLEHTVRRNGSADNSSEQGINNNWCQEKILKGRNYVIIYNAVPKTGSRTISALARTLFQKKNKDKQSIFIPYDLYRDETRLRAFYRKNRRGPKLLRGHSLYTPMMGRQYIYINTIRDPVERFISHLHYSWYGDSNNADKKNSSQVPDINRCVHRGGCLPTGYLPFFCGFHPNCSNTTDRWALETAVSNLDQYLVVGLTEEMGDTIRVLQKLLPDLFNGIVKEYTRTAKKMKKSYSTLVKQKPTEETLAKLRQAMAQTYEFYNIAKTRFHELKECLGIR